MATNGFMPILTPRSVPRRSFQRRGAVFDPSAPAFVKKLVAGRRIVGFSPEAARALVESMDSEGWVVERIDGPAVFRVGPRGSFRSVSAREAIEEMVPFFDVYLASSPEERGRGALLVGELPDSARAHAIPRAILPPGDLRTLVDPMVEESAAFLCVLSLAREVSL